MSGSTTVYNATRPGMMVTFKNVVIPLAWSDRDKSKRVGIMRFSVDPPQNIEVHVMNGAPNYNVERIVHFPAGQIHACLVEAGQFLKVMDAAGQGAVYSKPAVLAVLPFPADLHLAWSIQL